MKLLDIFKKMNKCFDYEIARDTGNQPIMKRLCYCRTTGCYQTVKIKDVSELDEYGIDQEKFYKKAFKTKIIMNIINKIICFFFGHKEKYLIGLHIGEWEGWYCERCYKNLRGRYIYFQDIFKIF